jgi:hypothetical protein
LADGLARVGAAFPVGRFGQAENHHDPFHSGAGPARPVVTNDGAEPVGPLLL